MIEAFTKRGSNILQYKEANTWSKLIFCKYFYYKLSASVLCKHLIYNNEIPVGFINKGNTCFANSILQILSVVPNLWSRVPLESNTLSPMLQAISHNMAVKKNSTKPVDPSDFLWALKCKLSIIRGVPFDFNTQQDVAEIMQVVLDEVKGISLAASYLIFNTQKITVSCNTCFCSSVSEENLDTVTLPVSTDIQTCMNQFLKPEILSSQNKWFCPSCNLLFESTSETCIINSAPILIIQLCRFSNQGGQLVKNENFFSCTQSERSYGSHNYRR